MELSGPLLVLALGWDGHARWGPLVAAPGAAMRMSTHRGPGRIPYHGARADWGGDDGFAVLMTSAHLHSKEKKRAPLRTQKDGPARCATLLVDFGGGAGAVRRRSCPHRDGSERGRRPCAALQPHRGRTRASADVFFLRVPAHPLRGPLRAGCDANVEAELRRGACVVQPAVAANSTGGLGQKNCKKREHQ